jgi:inhibitor of the pro-sigma K processing machinery
MVSLAALAVNAIVGLLVPIVANAVGIGVQISLVRLLICAVLGIPGAIIVILLALLNVACGATLVPLLL